MRLPDIFAPSVTVHLGDCLDVMPTIADNSIDAVVCDPPYHLTSIVKRFGAGNAAPAKDATFGRMSRGFMGKEWDGGDIAFRVETWAHVLRILKPGGHLLAFSGSRTYHRMVVAIEDAGFEIRDQIMWVYGSGFPKSHDVSKGIAKRRTEDVEPVRVICRAIRAAMDSAALKSKDLTYLFGDCNPRLIDHWAARDTDSQPSLPTMEQWEILKINLQLGATLDDEVRRLNERKGTHGARWSEADIIGEQTRSPAGFGDLRFEGDTTIRALDADAQKWQGWGSALKPAHEPIVMARKPLIGTIVENVLEHGTGAINIDACRIHGDETYEGVTKTGRFPANLIHDGGNEVVDCFPREAGSAARFFYATKASSADRAGSKHPTVKPISLMRYLVRMVTPPGGVVLDPFAGSGTTLMAARLEGFASVGIEMTPEYYDDICVRFGQ